MAGKHSEPLRGLQASRSPLFQGKFGRIQWGVQYSYTERKAFEGVGGAPSANENMVFTSFRYYPF